MSCGGTHHSSTVNWLGTAVQCGTVLLEFSSELALLGVTITVPVVMATVVGMATFIAMATLEVTLITFLTLREGAVVAKTT